MARDSWFDRLTTNGKDQGLPLPPDDQVPDLAHVLHREADAFAAVRAHPVFIEAIRRRAVPISMPRCKAIRAVNSRLVPFHDAALGHVRDGQDPLGMIESQYVLTWLRAMETAYSPILEWLP